MKIGYVCTNYNNSAFTCEAVESLTSSDSHEFRIVVVDNDSTVENVAVLRDLAARHANVTLILSDENAGYFPGLNRGIHYIREHHPEFKHLVVGNNDLVFAPDFGNSIASNLACFDKNAVISPDIVTMDGIHQNPHVVAKISKLREFVYDLYYLNYFLAKLITKAAKVTRALTDREDETHWKVAQHIYQGHGACYLIGPKFFEHFKELWAPTFLMGEEYFLSKQLSDVGMQVYYLPAIKVGHHCHVAVSRVPAKKMWEISRVAHKIYRSHVRYLG